MSDTFHHVLFPGTVTVLGIPLPPLSLWSLSVLQAIGSPFVASDAGTPARNDDFTLADLQVAVRCACAPLLKQPDLRPRLRDRWLWHRKHRSQPYLQAQAARFCAWLATHQRSPVLWAQENAEDRYLTAPLVLSTVAALMDLGMTHSEAWSCSPGYARWLILAKAERESNAVRFATDDDTDNQPDDELFDAFEQLSESDLIAQARADLPPETFAAWLKARSSIRHPASSIQP